MNLSVIAITAALSTGLTGLVAGALLFGSSVISRAERNLDGTFWLRLHQAMNRTADPLMPRLAVASAVASTGYLAMLVVRAEPVTITLGALAALGVLAGIVSSVSVNVPLNRRIDSWSAAAPPPELGAVRRRWTRFHVFRGATSFFGFACTVAATAVPVG